MRRLKILEYALSSLLRRKYKNLSLVIVYALTISILASILFLTHALKQEAEAVFSDAPNLIVQKLFAGRHDLISTDDIHLIRKIPGVGDVHPRYWGYYFDALSQSNYTFMGIREGLPGLKLVEGQMPAEEGECTIGRGVARAQFTGLGDQLVLIDSRNKSVKFRIVGIFDAASNLLSNDLVLMTRKGIQKFFDFPSNRATDIVVEVYNPEEISTVAAKIRKMLPGTRPIAKDEIFRTYDSVFNWRSGMMLTLFSAALFAFSILAWDKATGISGAEKNEIGILKAVGWDTADILELKFWEGIVISFTALLGGLTAAFVHVFFFNAPLLTPVLKGWSVLFPTFRLTPYIDLYQVFVIALLTVAPYIACTVIPSWKAAVTDPEMVMRS
ncbi:MAG: FtsX-like permease family protein [Deltaproteobacteria bacterium]|nr:FtsX-like permease family protein [Deltaproteobacteria bacterium]